MPLLSLIPRFSLCPQIHKQKKFSSDYNSDIAPFTSFDIYCRNIAKTDQKGETFSSISGKVSERPAWKDECWALLETDCDWWTASEGEAAVSSRQLELRWKSSAYRAWFVEWTDHHAWSSGDQDGQNCQRLCRQCCWSRQAQCLGHSQKSVQQFWTVSSEALAANGGRREEPVWCARIYQDRQRDERRRWVPFVVGRWPLQMYHRALRCSSQLG